MFKKHAVQMKIVKDTKSTQNDAPQTNPAQYVPIVRDLGKDAVKGAAALIGTYVAADTLRRCALHIVATKVQ